MKKKLLFSLLLGSSFVWMNGIYAEEVAKAVGAPVVVDKAGDSAGKAGDKPAELVKVKKYKAIDIDGKEIEVSFFKPEERPDIATTTLNLPDGEAYSGARKVNIPIKLDGPFPEGHHVVYVLRNKSNPDELKFVPADDDIGKYSAEYSADPKEWWMYLYKNKKGEYTLHPYNQTKDINAKTILGTDKLNGNDIMVYSYLVPDEEKTDLKEELTKAKSAGASSEEIAALKAQLEEERKSPSANMGNTGVLSQAVEVPGTGEGASAIQFVVTSTDKNALKDRALFNAYVEQFKRMVTYPSVKAQMLYEMVEEQLKLQKEITKLQQEVATPELQQKLAELQRQKETSNNFSVYTWSTTINGTTVVGTVQLSHEVTLSQIIKEISALVNNQPLDEKTVEQHVASLNEAAELEHKRLELENAKLQEELAAAKAREEAAKTVAAKALETAEENQKEADANAADKKELAITLNHNAAEADRLAKVVQQVTLEKQQVVANANQKIEAVAEIAKKAEEDKVAAEQKASEETQAKEAAEKVAKEKEEEARRLELEKTEIAAEHKEVKAQLTDAHQVIANIAVNSSSSTTDSEHTASVTTPAADTKLVDVKDHAAVITPAVEVKKADDHAAVITPAVEVKKADDHAAVTTPAVEVKKADDHAAVITPAVEVKKADDHAAVTTPAVEVKKADDHAVVTTPAVEVKKADDHAVVTTPAVEVKKADDHAAVITPATEVKKADDHAATKADKKEVVSSAAVSSAAEKGKEAAKKETPEDAAAKKKNEISNNEILNTEIR